MGNKLCSIGIADCFRPSEDYDEEFTINQTPENHFENPKNIFTISEFDKYDFLPSTKSYVPLNELQLNSDLIDMNLFKLSNNLCSSSASVYSMDSGYESNATLFGVDNGMNNSELVEISLQTISQYTTRINTPTFKAALDLDILYTSLFNIPYFLNNSLNRLVQKTETIFTSRFIAAMKARLNNKLIEKVIESEEYVQSHKSEVTVAASVIDSKTKSSDLNRGYPLSIFRIESIRNIISRIYDVNDF